MHDLRLAVRNLIRRPSVSVIATLTLALGIGANTAIFTVSHAVLLAPLPYSDPERVVILTENSPQLAGSSVTHFNYADWRARSQSFERMGAFRTTSMTLSGAGEPERLPVKMITADLLPLLGVAVADGRNFSAEEDRAGAPGRALISSAFARRRFAGDQTVGRVLQLDNHPYTIVGVLPAGFELFAPADVYVPFGPWAATLPDDRGWHPGILPIARLKADVTLDQARGEMDGIAQQLEAQYPDSNKNVRVLVNRVQDQVVQHVRSALWMLTGAVTLVLLIACANVANLLLARAVDRQKELAIRMALGATRSRIVRQLVVESVVLSVAGGAVGLLLASWAVGLLTATTVTGLPRAYNIDMNWNVVLFALGLSVLTGIVFGLAPAFQATHVPVQQSLNEEGRGGSGSWRQRRVRSGLVVAEIALALVLLVGAGLLLRSFDSLMRVDPGFHPDRLLVVNIPLSPQQYHDSHVRAATVDRIIARVRALPGVEGAAITTMLPMAGVGGLTIHFNRAAYPPKGPDDYVMAGYRAVTPEYLQTLGVPLKRGRMLEPRDTQEAPPVVVINEAMGRQYFPDREALGQRIQLGTEPDPDFPTMEVVGIVGDMKQSFDSGSKAEMFVPYAQFPDPILTGLFLNTALVVRTAPDAPDISASLRAAVGEIDPAQPLVNIRTMVDAMGATVAQPRLQMTLLVIFASIAVTLAAIGVYGVMAYSVSQRVPEIGVRIAVGASPAQVVGMVVAEGSGLAIRGIILGLAAALLVAGAMRSLLFEVAWLDPLTFIAAPLVLGVAALLASYIPARRAARISPVLALQK